jgi:hypothetical protein
VEGMAKTVTYDFKSFCHGKLVEKQEEKKNKLTLNINTVSKVTSVVLIGISVLNGDISTAFASSNSITAMVDPNFQDTLSKATKPIKDIIFGFAHEVYFVFMAWGALEALIGKPQQGFTRMKIATGAYILLFWVPWIVDQVNKVRPSF